MTNKIKVFFVNTPTVVIENVLSANVLGNGTLVINYTNADGMLATRSYADGFWLSSEYTDGDIND